MSLLISDSNVFIDFEVGGILDELFQLSDDIGVPDLLFEVELRTQHSHLIDFGLLLLEMGEDAILRTERLAEKYRNPSRLDLAALALAEQERCCLITGDKALRLAAEAEGAEVRGTLWICERLVIEEIISVELLEVAYDKMKTGNRRLPWGDVERQLRALRNR
jgi:predicted nucleic acid-binding protein